MDLTYDIRAIAPDPIGNADAPLPANKSQEKKWSKAIRERLADLVFGALAPQLAAALAGRALPAKARVEDSLLFIDYEPLSTGTSYVAPAVMLEFGARSPASLMSHGPHVFCAQGTVT